MTLPQQADPAPSGTDPEYVRLCQGQAQYHAETAAAAAARAELGDVDDAVRALAEVTRQATWAWHCANKAYAWGRDTDAAMNTRRLAEQCDELKAQVESAVQRKRDAAR